MTPTKQRFLAHLSTFINGYQNRLHEPSFLHFIGLNSCGKKQGRTKKKQELKTHHNQLNRYGEFKALPEHRVDEHPEDMQD